MELGSWGNLENVNFNKVYSPGKCKVLVMLRS